MFIKLEFSHGLFRFVFSVIMVADDFCSSKDLKRGLFSGFVTKASWLAFLGPTSSTRQWKKVAKRGRMLLDFIHE